MSEHNGHLDRAAILAQTKLPTMEIDIPEWGGKVFLRVMTAGERDQWEGQIHRRAGTGNEFVDIRARLAVLLVCDESGCPLFGSQDISAISQLHSKAVDRIFEAGMRFNGIGKADVDELKKTLSETP